MKYRQLLGILQKIAQSRVTIRTSEVSEGIPLPADGQQMVILVVDVAEITHE